MEAKKPISELTVAVIGFGSIGQRHFRNLARLGVKRRIVVRRAEGCNPAFTPPSGTAVVHTHEAALAERPDLAVICNPTRLHVEAASVYVEAGVPVLVEKPLGDRPADAARLVKISNAGELLAGMAYPLRYHPAYDAARSALAAGAIGRPLYAKAWFESYLPDWHPWEDYRLSYAARQELGGGVLPTLDHEIDFLNWCFGRPERFFGVCRRSGTLDAGVDDVALLTGTYASGPVVTIQLSLCRKGRSRGFELIGEHGTLRYSIDRGQLDRIAQDGAAVELIRRDCGDEIESMYVEMLADVLRAVAAGKKVAPVPLECGMRALQVCAEVQAAFVKDVVSPRDAQFQHSAEEKVPAHAVD